MTHVFFWKDMNKANMVIFEKRYQTSAEKTSSNILWEDFFVHWIIDYRKKNKISWRNMTMTLAELFASERSNEKYDKMWIWKYLRKGIINLLEQTSKYTDLHRCVHFLFIWIESVITWKMKPTTIIKKRMIFFFLASMHLFDIIFRTFKIEYSLPNVSSVWNQTHIHSYTNINFLQLVICASSGEIKRRTTKIDIWIPSCGANPSFLAQGQRLRINCYFFLENRLYFNRYCDSFWSSNRWRNGTKNQGHDSNHIVWNFVWLCFLKFNEDNS